MRMTGILGGTFDPVHNGHLAIAGESLKTLGLEKVLFVPAWRQPLKDREDMETVENRLNMISLAIEDIPQYQLSTVETDVNGPSYTVDTLGILKEQYGDDTELYFIMGWDSLEEMPRWKKPQEIIKFCRVVAFTRDTVSPPAVRQLDKVIPGLGERLILIDIPPVDISSTDIRRRLRQGLSIHGMVPQKVEDYIKEHALYR